MPELLAIIGQDGALAQLQRAVAARRRPHAYLFVGPDGVGRRTLAVELGRLLLCEAPASRANRGQLAPLPDDFSLQQACGACRSCTGVSADTHPDLHLIYKELARYHDDPAVRQRKMQELSIEVIRQFLIGPAYRAASSGRGKLFIVLEAQLLSPAAQNCLLKTLEEPPSGVTIILICTRAEDLLPTTRSRCQLVRFGPLPLEFVTEMLAEEDIHPEQARFLAALTGGSIGQAKRLARSELYPLKRDLVARLGQGAPAAGPELAELLVAAMDTRAKALAKEDDSLTPAVARRRASQTLLELLGSVYRDALHLASGVGGELVHADQSQAIAALAGRFDPTTLAEILAQLSRYEQLLWRNVNAKLLWDNVAITCSRGWPLEV